MLSLGTQFWRLGHPVLLFSPAKRARLEPLDGRYQAQPGERGKSAFCPLPSAPCPLPSALCPLPPAFTELSTNANDGVN